MNESLQEIQNRFMGEIAYVDEVAQIVLKGHLAIEELMTEAIERFVLHGEFIAEVKLQFHQKLTLCRAISVNEQDNPMWGLIGKINNVRNHLSHSLNDNRRAEKIQALRSNYEQHFGREALDKIQEMSDEAAVCMLAVSGCLGYLHTFVEEVKRFERIVSTLNETMNGRGNA